MTEFGDGTKTFWNLFCAAAITVLVIMAAIATVGMYLALSDHAPPADEVSIPIELPPGGIDIPAGETVTIVIEEGPDGWTGRVEKEPDAMPTMKGRTKREGEDRET